MKNKYLRIFALATVVFMLVSTLPSGALAASENAQNGQNGMSEANEQDEVNEEEKESADETSEDTEEDNDPPGIQDHERDRDMVNASDAPRKMVAQKIVNRLQQAKDTRDAYLEAKENFAKVKGKDNSLRSEEAFEAARDYLTAGIDEMIERIKRAENIENSEEYIYELENIRKDVSQASTRKELSEAAKDINMIWKDVRNDIVSRSASKVNIKLNSAIKTSNSLIVRLENEIQRMEDNGEDVEELEEMLEEYKELIAEAEENSENARESYRQGNGEYGDALRYMNEAGRNINEANDILKDMLRDIKKHREGVVVLNGSGELKAEGEGTAVLSGDLSLDLSATGAKLVIKDLAGNATINVDGAEYESSNIDSGNSTDNNRAFVFVNLTGDIYIEGNRLTIMVRGTDMEFTAEGTGNAILSGDGTYETETASGNWAEKPEEGSEEEVEEVPDETSEEEEEEIGGTAGDEEEEEGSEDMNGSET